MSTPHKPDSWLKMQNIRRFIKDANLVSSPTLNYLSKYASKRLSAISLMLTFNKYLKKSNIYAHMVKESVKGFKPYSHFKAESIRDELKYPPNAKRYGSLKVLTPEQECCIKEFHDVLVYSRMSYIADHDCDDWMPSELGLEVKLSQCIMKAEYCPAFCILHEPKSNTGVISIRGVFARPDIRPDILTVLQSFPIKYRSPLDLEATSEHEYCQAGMWGSAISTYTNIFCREDIVEYLNSIDKLIITGHSLGAATATLLDIMLEDTAVLKCPRRVYSVSCPPVINDVLLSRAKNTINLMHLQDPVARMALQTYSSILSDGSAIRKKASKKRFKARSFSIPRTTTPSQIPKQLEETLETISEILNREGKNEIVPVELLVPENTIALFEGEFYSISPVLAVTPIVPMIVEQHHSVDVLTRYTRHLVCHSSENVQ